MHLTLKRAVWIDQGERWIAELTECQISHGLHRNVWGSEAAINRFPAVHSDKPKPFISRKPTEQIRNSLKTYCNGT